MTADAQAILQEVLSLPVDDRADIAAELLLSLEPPADDPERVRTLWNEELVKRAKQLLSGEAIEEDWAIVRQRIADDLAG